MNDNERSETEQIVRDLIDARLADIINPRLARHLAALKASGLNSFEVHARQQEFGEQMTDWYLEVFPEILRDVMAQLDGRTIQRPTIH